jgi:hypothetical protein
MMSGQSDGLVFFEPLPGALLGFFGNVRIWAISSIQYLSVTPEPVRLTVQGSFVACVDPGLVLLRLAHVARLVGGVTDLFQTGTSMLLAFLANVGVVDCRCERMSTLALCERS